MGQSPLFVDRVLDAIVDMHARLDVALLIVEHNAELALSIARRGVRVANCIDRPRR